MKEPWNKKRPFESLYNKLRSDARVRGRDFQLTFEEFVEFTATPRCHYCDRPVVWTRHNITRPKSNAYNLDRMNNEAGYTKQNLVVCCPICNVTKGNRFSYEEFKVMIAALVEFRRYRVL